MACSSFFILDYIDVGGGCWWRLVLVTSIWCCWRFWLIRLSFYVRVRASEKTSLTTRVINQRHDVTNITASPKSRCHQYHWRYVFVTVFFNSFYRLNKNVHIFVFDQAVSWEAFQFRWRKIKRNYTAFPISITLFANHLKWNSSEDFHFHWCQSAESRSQRPRFSSSRQSCRFYCAKLTQQYHCENYSQIHFLTFNCFLV